MTYFSLLEPAEPPMILIWHCPICKIDIHEDDVEFTDTCSECDSPTREVTAGDEGWTVCDPCGTVEPKTHTVDQCCECGTNLPEPEAHEAEPPEPIID